MGLGCSGSSGLAIVSEIPIRLTIARKSRRVFMVIATCVGGRRKIGRRRCGWDARSIPGTLGQAAMVIVVWLPSAHRTGPLIVTVSPATRPRVDGSVTRLQLAPIRIVPLWPFEVVYVT